MHELALKALVQTVRERAAQGDYPTADRPGPELLENVVLDLADRSGIDAKPDLEQNVLVFRAYHLVFEISASFENPAHLFEHFAVLWERASAAPSSLLGFIARTPEGSEENPWPWLGAVGQRTRRYSGAPLLPAPGMISIAVPETRKTFEVRAHIPLPFTAESLLDAIADELETHGWGVCGLARGVVFKEDQEEWRAHIASRAKVSDQHACRACGEWLVPSNHRIADGCPCNSPRGVNHGLVSIQTCTCVECDPRQTGASRSSAPSVAGKPLY